MNAQWTGLLSYNNWGSDKNKNKKNRESCSHPPLLSNVWSASVLSQSLEARSVEASYLFSLLTSGFRALFSFWFIHPGFSLGFCIAPYDFGGGRCPCSRGRASLPPSCSCIFPFFIKSCQCKLMMLGEHQGCIPYSWAAVPGIRSACTWGRVGSLLFISQYSPKSPATACFSAPLCKLPLSPGHPHEPHPQKRTGYWGQ